ncbi:MAG: prepilin peptidase [Gemmatimonadaceae bacterium]
MGLFAGTPIGMLAGITFTAILVMAAIGDMRTRRIPNRLVAILAVLGFAFSVSQRPVFAGTLHGFEGLAVGLACWLPFYVLGWLGAGDVKLFAAAGAWLGPLGALEGALIGALSGAVLAVLWMLRAHGVRSAVQTLGMAAGSPGILSSPARGEKGRSTLPYGVAIAFGAICAAWIPGLLLG